jgi:methylglutaconyl-CoA hydratase
MTAVSNSVTTTLDPHGVATVTLDRPAKHNAFDDALIAELTEKLLQLGRDPAVRVVVLTGAGPSFSAGGDLEWMRSMARFTEAQNLEDADRLAELMSVLDTCPKPTVARVNGQAYGGGVGLIACCDVAIAVEGARFALTEVRLGLAPAVIAPFVINAIGERHARRWFLSAEAFDAARAREVGLVHEVVPAAGLDAAVTAVVDALLAGGPVAQAQAKQLLLKARPRSAAAARELRKLTVRTIAQLRAGAEGQDGLAAFLEKRAPGWKKPR